MANNTNAAAVNFANTKARPMFDEAYSFYLTAKKFLQLWNGGNFVSIIPNDANLIDDGSLPTDQGGGDGRLSITDGQVNILVSNMTTFVNSFEANANLVLNQCLQGQVNGQSRI